MEGPAGGLNNFALNWNTPNITQWFSEPKSWSLSSIVMLCSMPFFKSNG